MPSPPGRPGPRPREMRRPLPSPSTGGSRAGASARAGRASWGGTPPTTGVSSSGSWSRMDRRFGLHRHPAHRLDYTRERGRPGLQGAREGRPGPGMILRTAPSIDGGMLWMKPELEVQPGSRVFITRRAKPANATGRLPTGTSTSPGSRIRIDLALQDRGRWKAGPHGIGSQGRCPRRGDEPGG